MGYVCIESSMVRIGMFIVWHNYITATAGSLVTLNMSLLMLMMLYIKWNSQFRNSFILSYTHQETFIDMKDKFFPWIKQFLEDSKWSLFPIIVVGTKCDLLDKRQVSYDMARVSS